jgi:hypothetical protein
MCNSIYDTDNITVFMPLERRRPTSPVPLLVQTGVRPMNQWMEMDFANRGGYLAVSQRNQAINKDDGYGFR